MPEWQMREEDRFDDKILGSGFISTMSTSKQTIATLNQLQSQQQLMQQKAGGEQSRSLGGVYN